MLSGSFYAVPASPFLDARRAGGFRGASRASRKGKSALVSARDVWSVDVLALRRGCPTGRRLIMGFGGP